ncbi:MAG: hypothetical protein HC780_19910 [Leptolyngbyaceae cyanobacterium CSU_1_3]|nr:hypothetical protein [Leptolyngbyaceae cyanobacterium CSU_1_3]
MLWELAQERSLFGDPIFARSKPRLADEQTVRLLEERIANLEAIASHSELDMQHQFKQLEWQKRNEQCNHENQAD